MRYLGTKNVSADVATQGDLGGGGSGGTAITGEIKMWPTSAAPSGYLLCDGAAVSRSTYSDLFTLVGTTFGVGDGSTTFNLPNFTDRFPRGDSTPGDVGGASTVTLSVNELPAHTHTQPTHTHTQPTHSHTQPTHTHTINHDHAAATTSSDGIHKHSLGRSAAGGGLAAVSKGTNTPDGSWVNAVDDSPSHTHTLDLPSYSGTSGADGDDVTGLSGGDVTGAGGGDTTGSTGSGAAFSVLNPYLGIAFIIKT